MSKTIYDKARKDFEDNELAVFYGCIIVFSIIFIVGLVFLKFKLS